MPPIRATRGRAEADLVTALSALPKELRRAVRPALLAAARPVLAEARSRSSWSTRIPGSLVLTAQFAGPRPGVRIAARRAVAPHARPYEGLGSGSRGTFRHPVFRTPSRDVWVEQRTRAFLLPAVQANRERIVTELGDALTSSAAAAGWRVR